MFRQLVVFLLVLNLCGVIALAYGIGADYVATLHHITAVCK